MSSCDVVIVNYNAIDLLADSVRSALAEGARYVFVVDNDSHDASLADLSATIADVRVTFSRNVQNLGFAAACNIGARTRPCQQPGESSVNLDGAHVPIHQRA